MNRLFDLPPSAQPPKTTLIPVPWDATASYHKGSSQGPKAILEASSQLDLFDRNFGRADQIGIDLLPIPEEILQWNRDALKDPHPETVNLLSKKLNQWVLEQSRKILDENQFAGVIGGEHSAPFGLIQALSERTSSFGILHMDAHHDLRKAYQGYTHSHASIFYNCVTQIENLEKLVSVGIRDFSEEEYHFAQSQAHKITAFYDADLSRLKFQGVAFEKVAFEILQPLPQDVYISFDIDGLAPQFCPHTGTPVPGGLSFSEAIFLLQTLVQSGRKIIGFDLCEVAPGSTTDWDANVGMRLLYQLCGWQFKSHRLL